MLSSHRGIFSLGLVVAIGVVCLWVASVTILPSLLALWGRLADRVPVQRLRLAGVPGVPREAWVRHTAAVHDHPADSRGSITHGAIKGGTS